MRPLPLFLALAALAVPAAAQSSRAGVEYHPLRQYWTDLPAADWTRCSKKLDQPGLLKANPLKKAFGLDSHSEEGAVWKVAQTLHDGVLMLHLCVADKWLVVSARTEGDPKARLRSVRLSRDLKDLTVWTRVADGGERYFRVRADDLRVDKGSYLEDYAWLRAQAGPLQVWGEPDAEVKLVPGQGLDADAAAHALEILAGEGLIPADSPFLATPRLRPAAGRWTQDALKGKTTPTTVLLQFRTAPTTPLQDSEQSFLVRVDGVKGGWADEGRLAGWAPYEASLAP